MINDLVVSDACVWKYVDDTTTSEVVLRGTTSGAQLIADKLAEWSRNNRVQLNTDKCKELRISFAKKKQAFELVKVDGKRSRNSSKCKVIGNNHLK